MQTGRNVLHDGIESVNLKDLSVNFKNSLEDFCANFENSVVYYTT
jgi:hypothetical protein